MKVEDDCLFFSSGLSLENWESERGSVEVEGIRVCMEGEAEHKRKINS